MRATEAATSAQHPLAAEAKVSGVGAPGPGYDGFAEDITVGEQGGPGPYGEKRWEFPGDEPFDLERWPCRWALGLRLCRPWLTLARNGMGSTLPRGLHQQAGRRSSGS